MKLKNYETIFVLTPVLTKEQIEAAIAKFRNFIMEKKADIVHEENMGFKKLVYPIQHKTTGVYYLIEFRASPDVIGALETEYNRDEKVIRFSTLLLDKHGVEYNEKKRNGAFSSSTETKEVVL
ncbi:MAG: 30S ribosomal protein S6 [Bacteroidota bacterium]